jgi:hypothetical protein
LISENPARQGCQPTPLALQPDIRLSCGVDQERLRAGTHCIWLELQLSEDHRNFANPTPCASPPLMPSAAKAGREISEYWAVNVGFRWSEVESEQVPRIHTFRPISIADHQP